MLKKIKTLIIKLLFSPLWLGVLLLVLFLKGFNIAFQMGWRVKPIKDVLEYWRL